MEHVVVFAALVAGLADGAARLSDNSMLVHLATGLHILNTGHVPHTDPYSFTAHGDTWTVQSWLPEVVYGALWKLGGGHLFIAFNMALYALFGAAIAAVSRTGNWLRTALVVGSVIGIGFSTWSARPNGFAMVFLLLTVVVINRRKSAWWLVPVAALWINSHGSWPLGIVFIFAAGLGACFDRQPVRNYLRYFLSFTAAALVGGLLSPAGWRILTFPLIPIGSRSPAFANIIEWQSPNFRSTDLASGFLVLISLLAMLAVLLRHRPSWSQLLPLVVFMGASLAGQRNLPMLGIVAAPILAVALKSEVPIKGPPEKLFSVSSRLGLHGAALLAVLLVIAIARSAVMLNEPPLQLSSYPVRATNWLESQNMLGGQSRVLAPDWVGCYFIYRKGQDANVFIDDRYDMYPPSIPADAHSLTFLDEDPTALLQKYKFNALLVEHNTRLSEYLDVDFRWKLVWGDTRWQIFEPASKVGA